MEPGLVHRASQTCVAPGVPVAEQEPGREPQTILSWLCVALSIKAAGPPDILGNLTDNNGATKG